MNKTGAQIQLSEDIQTAFQEDHEQSPEVSGQTDQSETIRYRRILLLECGVTRPDSTNPPYIPSGTEVRLERVPEYPDDRWAIRVLTKDGVLLGFLPYGKNQSVARLMDAGKRITGVRVNPFDDSFQKALRNIVKDESTGCALRICMEIPVNERSSYEPAAEGNR